MNRARLLSLTLVAATVGCGAQRPDEQWADEYLDPAAELSDHDRAEAVHSEIASHADVQTDQSVFVLTALRYLEPRRIGSLRVAIDREGSYRGIGVVDATLSFCPRGQRTLPPIDVAALERAVSRLPPGEDVPDSEDLILVSWRAADGWWTRRYLRSAPPLELEAVLELVQARRIAAWAIGVIDRHYRMYDFESRRRPPTPPSSGEL